MLHINSIIKRRRESSTEKHYENVQFFTYIYIISILSFEELAS